MAKECPRCSARVERFVCPACGLDLQLHAELKELRADLQHLGSPPPLPAADLPRQTAEPTGTTAKAKPATLPASGGAASRQPGQGARGLSEVAVGQRWFLALGVV